MTHAWEKLLDPESVKLLKQCRSCGAKCCKYLTVQIDDPGDEIDDWEAVRWYLTRPNTIVYVDEDGDWFLQVSERCRFLQDDWTCGIYATRPKVCADHDPKECEFWANPEDAYIHCWHSFEEFDAYYLKDVKPELERKVALAKKKRSTRARKAASARWSVTSPRASRVRRPREARRTPRRPHAPPGPAKASRPRKAVTPPASPRSRAGR